MAVTAPDGNRRTDTLADATERLLAAQRAARDAVAGPTVASPPREAGK